MDKDKAGKLNIIYFCLFSVTLCDEPPSQDKQSNWLPAPKGDFVLMFRFYWPKPEILEGKWQLPAVKKAA